ncbi:MULTISPECIES: cytosine deaminase [unclassified Shinella]|uniref:cytosine deaminase n=1 Tax=unclassified Shinella TaxID=2643062 RepID=UPI00225C5A6A|nr:MULTISPECIES: cytosine deaminase [unclassified Shinella]MCO5139551.1 cytosine deaminase [Shinella sp.]MDC7258450.1 cytosine deaminase [Shinella sp. YE25]CAI0334786.1 Pterin deaminase [Rhizobiaceae bacterium]CAK7260211.1 Pterin deaminase [Shinella sp. WSC3-e]
MTATVSDQSALRAHIDRAAGLGRYVLRNVRLHTATTRADAADAADSAFFLADVSVEKGRILAITPARPRTTTANDPNLPLIDVGGRVALPPFVDCHTHLDKGHILPRTPAADGTFDGALAATRSDRTARWSAGDLGRRIEFALRSAFHYGTSAIRTHLDSQPPQAEISWPLFTELRQHWRGRLALQASCLFPIDMARDDAFLRDIAKRVADAGGILGAVAYPVPDIDHLLDRMFRAASHYGLDLDFHADESADPAADMLCRIAETALRSSFAGRIVAGHCCSLAMQETAIVDATLDKVAAAGITVVSLPTCNLYLQDRRKDGTSPRWRGVTLLHEMKRRGIAVALASDNTRDPFNSYGDLDMLDTFRLGTRALHLDHPHGDWIKAVSTTPAGIMRLNGHGAIAAGQPADLILFEGRSWSEILSRAESDRIVIRNGSPSSAPLPAYAELDSLEGFALT